MQNYVEIQGYLDTTPYPLNDEWHGSIEIRDPELGNISCYFIIDSKTEGYEDFLKSAEVLQKDFSILENTPDAWIPYIGVSIIGKLTDRLSIKVSKFQKLS